MKMELTQIEKQYLAKLKRRDAQLVRLRYINLALAIISLLMAFVGLAFFLEYKEGILFERLSSHPIFYILCMGGGLAIANALKGFRGDPATRLLIKLAEQNAHNESK